MTDKALERAKQIKRDIKALESMTMNRDASQELVRSWNNWANAELERLKKEFAEL